MFGLLVWVLSGGLGPRGTGDFGGVGASIPPALATDSVLVRMGAGGMPPALRVEPLDDVPVVRTLSLLSDSGTLICVNVVWWDARGVSSSSMNDRGRGGSSSDSDSE